MALLIRDICSECDACREECPNQAITAGRPYRIDPARCTECVGAFDEPQCVSVCPVDACIAPDPNHAESKAELLEKYGRVHA